MISRVLHGVWIGFVYFCVATLIAEILIATYCWTACGLSRDKFIHILAVAHGIDLSVMKEAPPLVDDPVSPEQVSYQQVLDTRAVKVRDLELREEALGNGLVQLRAGQQKLADERRRQADAETTLESQLTKMEDTAKVEGMENVRQTVAKVSPKQAKQLILLMLEKDELDDVVQLLTGMPEGKRAKIVGEFKTPEDLEKIGEVLRRIRRGEPDTALAEKAKRELP